MFEPAMFRFLRELARHNDRGWFLANKSRYEAVVQGPAVRFVAAVGPILARLSPELVADPRPFGGSVTRIYRDTRFSKDKSPYRTHVGIIFHHRGARQDDHLPGYYVHLAPGGSFVAAGIWRPSAPSLKRIRDALVADPRRWERMLKGGIVLEGDSYARVPPGYAKDGPHADDLRRKDFIASRPFPDARVTGADFGAEFEGACRTLAPLNAFLAKAVGAPW